MLHFTLTLGNFCIAYRTNLVYVTVTLASTVIMGWGLQVTSASKATPLK